MSKAKTIFTVELRDEPGHTSPTATRLRMALKTLLRLYGLRAVSVRETPAATPPPTVRAPQKHLVHDRVLMYSGSIDAANELAQLPGITLHAVDDAFLRARRDGLHTDDAVVHLRTQFRRYVPPKPQREKGPEIV